MPYPKDLRSLYLIILFLLLAFVPSGAQDIKKIYPTAPGKELVENWIKRNRTDFPLEGRFIIHKDLYFEKPYWVPWIEGQMGNGLPQGEWKVYNNGGHLVKTITYKDGALHGKSISYDLSGPELISYNYANGRMFGLNVDRSYDPGRQIYVSMIRNITDTFPAGGRNGWDLRLDAWGDTTFFMEYKDGKRWKETIYSDEKYPTRLLNYTDGQYTHTDTLQWKPIDKIHRLTLSLPSGQTDSMSFLQKFDSLKYYTSLQDLTISVSSGSRYVFDYISDSLKSSGLLPQIRKLNFSFLNLEFFPPFILKCSELAELSLQLRLKVVPKNISTLKKLRRIELQTFNQLEMQPSFIHLTALENLKELVVHSASDKALPAEIALFKDLEVIELNWQGIQSSFPMSLYRFKKLRSLKLGKANLWRMTFGHEFLQFLPDCNIPPEEKGK